MTVQRFMLITDVPKTCGCRMQDIDLIAGEKIDEFVTFEDYNKLKALFIKHVLEETDGECGYELYDMTDVMNMLKGY